MKLGIRKSIPYILRFILAGWAIGIGLRFVFEWLRGGGQSVWYNIFPFDVVFDWGFLAILGFFNATLLQKDIIIENRRNKPERFKGDCKQYGNFQ